MKLKWDNWFYNLLKSVIGGVAATGGAYIGTLVGNQITADIPVMNWKSLGFVVLFSSLSNLFFYLQKSPVPEESTTEQLIKKFGEGPTPPLPLLLLLGVLCVSVATVPGCVPRGASKPTPQAMAFMTLAQTKSLVDNAEKVYGNLVVQGYVSKTKQLEIDAKIVTFHQQFGLAVKIAKANYSAATPADVQTLADQLVTTINTLSK